MQTFIQVYILLVDTTGLFRLYVISILLISHFTNEILVKTLRLYQAMYYWLLKPRCVRSIVTIPKPSEHITSLICRDKEEYEPPTCFPIIRSQVICKNVSELLLEFVRCSASQYCHYQVTTSRSISLLRLIKNTKNPGQGIKSKTSLCRY